MLGLVFSAYLFFTIIMCFIRIRIGMAMFLFYSILVPFLKFFSFGENLFPFIILLALFYNYGFKELIYKPLMPFLFLYVAQFCIIPFHDIVPYTYQMNMLRVDVMGTLLLPFAMINVMYKDRKAITLFSKTLIAAVIVAMAYTLFLTLMPGINPYMMAVLPLSGGEFSDSYALAEDGGRVFGRISGVFTHPMTNGLFLCLALIYLLSFVNFEHLFRNKLHLLLIFLVLISILVMGVRTAIGAVGFGLIGILFFKKKFMLLLYASIALLVVFVAIKQIPEMNDYVMSIFDSESTNVNGSSKEMRLSQLDGCMNEIKHNYFFGDGYAWTAYYKNLHGDHPIMLAFEGLLLVILCNNGFAGVIMWIFMIFLYVKIILQNFSFKNGYAHVLLALMITYLVYSLVTGEYGYMKYFLIFYALIWMRGESELLKFKSNIIKIKLWAKKRAL